MPRFSLLIAIMTILPFASGCSGSPRGGANVGTATQVTLEQLSGVTAHLPMFYYIGSDDEFHFFRGDGIGYFRLTRSESIPEFPSMDGSDISIDEIALFVTIKDGKLTAPGPGAFPLGEF
ncbi:hypothetical protein [Novipirellula caenicola]|uniref:Uncharacterized protein n=1 Tax=Novipirellula caenicola TaxID=1536901 RepID=A0ABP9W1J3_9BACT